MAKPVIDIHPLHAFFQEQVDPRDLADYLSEIEESYTSYVLRDEGAPRLKSDNQIYYLRELRKAISRIPVVVPQ